MHSVAIAGHVCVDISPGMEASTRIEPGKLFEVGPLRLELGGCVANTGGDLADLGMPVHVHTTVGDDDLGRLVSARLAARPGITGTPLVAAGASTSYSLVLETPGADRTFWHHVGANHRFDGTGVDLAAIDLLHLGYPPLLPGLLVNGGAPLAELLARARAAGVTTSVDLAVVDRDSETGSLDWERILRSAMAHTDIVSPSLDDLTSALGIDEPPSDELVDRLAELLLDWGAAIVAISAGSRGLWLRTASASRLAAAGRALADDAEQWAGIRMHRPPVEVSVQSTTNGAGDASTAGLLYAIAAGAGPVPASGLATACSAAIIAGERTTPETITALRPELGDLVATTTGASLV
ncbi:carbohydrate kinase family protein [Compostimonas suwonensis]|uniref:Sugar/nucleoside kinase (Ribokinase family) n=1 Tax=Compostimonas suwonensis TaxID=1048394 RepID=A0A2M9BCX1_9MICO|nr:PfkB family carbohydrate kinase [Compostimonas suwonensis]PJJ55798.1 sugar/nucleoside kinase (ribokinase family) [Compostimonas suwonensis]